MPSPFPGMDPYLENPAIWPDYLVLINRAWTRASDGTGHQVFPFGLRDSLPCIPVPLRQGEAEVPLDLQFLFNHIYDAGPYRRGAVDYTEPPDPPLPAEEALWAGQILRGAGPGKR